MSENHLVADIPQKAIIEHNGKVLLVRNSEAHWQLPGGRLNEGESPLEGIVREIKEELGADINPVSIFDTFVFQSKSSGRWHYAVVYVCKLLSKVGDLKDLTGEAAQIVWVGSAKETDHLVNDGSIMWKEYKQVLEKYFREKNYGK